MVTEKMATKSTERVERPVISRETAREIGQYVESLTPDMLALDDVQAVELVSANARKIIELQSKGVKLKTVYRNLIERYKIGISYGTFVQYLSVAAVQQNIKRTVRPRYNCQECRQKATRRAFPENKGYYWQCPACGTNYHDQNGRLSARQYPPRQGGQAAPATATASTATATA